jgi:hypothetical protein
MPRPMYKTKPSAPLGVSYTLVDLLRRVAQAIETYGPETKIYG